MRAGALLAIAASVLVAAYFIARGPGPETAAQSAARAAADSLTRARLAAFGQPRTLLTGATRRGRLAWAAAERDGRSNGTVEENRQHPWRHSAAFLLQDDGWRVMLENDSRTDTWEELRAGAAAGTSPRRPR